MTTLAIDDTHPVARPLDMLVGLIREDLAQAEKAGIPYYRAAGEKLLEASHAMGDDKAKFKAWVKRNFKVTFSQATIYMKLVEDGGAYSSLQEFRRAKLGYKQTVHPQPWHEPIKEAIGRVNIDALKQDALAKAQERELQRKLALSLIDIGYKALATKLHPDKGGNPAAMGRLNRVRELLKECLK